MLCLYLLFKSEIGIVQFNLLRTNSSLKLVLKVDFQKLLIRMVFLRNISEGSHITVLVDNGMLPW